MTTSSRLRGVARRQKGLLPITFVVLWACAAAPVVRGWWPVPHMIVGEIAKAHLTAEAKAHFEQALAAWSSFWPQEASAQSSTLWADAIKSEGMDLFDAWHFVDFPIVADGAAPPPPLDRENAVWALEKCIAALRSRSSSLWTRALATRLLMHITGDIHQPLHSATRYSARLPGGDLGGNLVPVQQSAVKGAANLHAFWDAGAGAFADVRTSGAPEPVAANFTVAPEDLAAAAMGITGETPRSSLQPKEVQSTNVTAWALEAHALAVLHAYGGNVAPSLDAALERPVLLGDTYVNRAQSVVRSQLATAGYRLAYLLNGLYPSMPDAELADPVCAGKGRGGDRAAPVLATALGLLLAVALALIAMLLRERERHRGPAPYTDFDNELAHQGGRSVAARGVYASGRPRRFDEGVPSAGGVEEEEDVFADDVMQGKQWR